MPSNALYFKGTIVDDLGRKKLKVTTETLYKRIIDSFKVGTKLSLIVEEEKNRRSLTQNAYYWVYLGVIAEETGHLPEELHAYFKRVMLPPKNLTVLGKSIKVPKSTADLSKIEFGDYLDKIVAETNISLPDPEAAGYISNNKPYN